MVEVTDPRLGETVLDPACGTGGFLVEAYQHLEKQCRKAEHRQTLQQKSVFGGEAKPLPYLLAQMNLLLHGLEAPQISPDNSLAVKLSEIGDKDRVDVIMTNPPFGGEEERGVINNFPEDKKTAETALLFMQLIMRKLRRPPRPGRAAVIVPDGFLFGEGVGARVKEELLTNFSLHTIVRLSKGVFAPYTGIQSNLLFFDRSGPTKELWFYEMPLPAGRKNYSKTTPMQYEEFADCLAWWKNRAENDRAWRIDFAAKYKQARVEAEPHWAAAETADAKAKELARAAKETADEIQRLKKPEIPLLKNTTEPQRNEKEIARLEAKHARLLAAEAEERERARQEQATGDGIYWPIFNLDIKNPSAKEDFEHLPPEQLADDILRKEQRIAELMVEIKLTLTGGGK
jgi:type I restriction enzyme M protein